MIDLERLRYLASPESERMSDYQRLNEFVKLGHEAVDMIADQLNTICDLATENEQLRAALTLAEDVLSRAPYSTEIWPNGMHPQTGIETIRAAITSGDRG
jgi:hypothetical protein